MVTLGSEVVRSENRIEFRQRREQDRDQRNNRTPRLKKKAMLPDSSIASFIKYAQKRRCGKSGRLVSSKPTFITRAEGRHWREQIFVNSFLFGTCKSMKHISQESPKSKYSEVRVGILFKSSNTIFNTRFMNVGIAI